MRSLNIWLLLLLVAVVAAAAGCSAQHPQTPTGLVTFKPSDNAFICQVPANWKGTSYASMSTSSGGEWVSGPAHIKIDSDMSGSMLGDVANGQNAQAQNLASQLGTAAPPPKPVVDQIHQQAKAGMLADHPDYTELSTTPFQTAFGEGRSSEFTMDSGKTHGYRVTIMGHDRSITVFCESPQDDWPKLQPYFQQVIMSFQPGPPS